MTDPILIVCLRVKDYSIPPIVPSFVEHCSKCGEAIWISPSSRETRNGLISPLTICNKCLPNEDFTIRITSEQIKELIGKKRKNDDHDQ